MKPHSPFPFSLQVFSTGSAYSTLSDREAEKLKAFYDRVSCLLVKKDGSSEDIMKQITMEMKNLDQKVTGTSQNRIIDMTKFSRERAETTYLSCRPGAFTRSDSEIPATLILLLSHQCILM